MSLYIGDSPDNPNGHTATPVIGTAWSNVTAQVRANWKKALAALVIPGGLIALAVWFFFFRKPKK